MIKIIKRVLDECPGLPSNACYSSTVCLSSFILGMQGLCMELFHPVKFCLHCSYAYEAMAAFLLKNGKHESGAWLGGLLYSRSPFHSS